MERNERKVLKFGGWDVREENLLMESEMRKKDRKDFFFFSPCEQLCSLLFLPVRREGWELLLVPLLARLPGQPEQKPSGSERPGDTTEAPAQPQQPGESIWGSSAAPLPLG